MQTERVTFLTTPDHKAALDAFAASNGAATRTPGGDFVDLPVAERARRLLAHTP